MVKEILLDQWCYFHYEVVLKDIKNETKKSLSDKIIRLNELLSGCKRINKDGIEFYFFTMPNKDLLGLRIIASNILNGSIDISSTNTLTLELTNEDLESFYKAIVCVDYEVDKKSGNILIRNINLEDTCNGFTEDFVYNHLLRSLADANLDADVIKGIGTRIDPIELDNLIDIIKEKLN